MIHLTSAVLVFLVAAEDPKKEPDKELQAKLATITKQLNSKKQTDVLAGLDAAQKLEDKAEPLIRRICEHVFSKSDSVAGPAADCLKEVAPKIHLTVLGLRQVYAAPTVNPMQVFEMIGKLEEDGLPLSWLVHAQLNQIKKPEDQQQLALHGFNVLFKMGDVSEAHWQLAKKFKSAGTTSQSYNHFVENDKAKKIEHVKAFIITRPNWTVTDIEQIASLGKDAKDTLTKLKAVAKLSPDVATREAATEAIEKIEAALKEKKP